MKIKYNNREFNLDESKLSSDSHALLKKMAKPKDRFPGAKGFDDGGTVQVDPDKAQQVSDSFKGAVHKFADGGESSSDSQSPDAELIQQTGGTQPDPAPTPVQSSNPNAPVNIHIYNTPQPSAGPAPQAPAPVDQSQQLVDKGINPSAPDAQQQAINQGIATSPASDPNQWSGSYGVAKPDQSVPATTPAPASISKPAAMQSNPAAPTDLDNTIQKNNQDYQALLQQQQEGDRKFENALATKQVDPNRYLNNADLGTKIFHGLGMLLSVAAPNIGKTILANINDNINRDIDAQKDDQSNTLNLWKMHRAALGDDMSATLQTRNNMLQMAKVKTDEMMGNLGNNPLAQEKAKALKLSLDTEMAQNNSIIAQQKMKQKLISGQGTNSNQDPATLVPVLVPPEKQKDVFDEIKNSQNITENGPKILAAFDQAAKEQRVMTGGISGAKNLIPGVNSQGVGDLHQLLLPNFKSIDGTVRQAAMDETFHNVTPQAFDGDAKIAQKRQALQDWLHSEAAAPTAKGFGIDLNKYSSTQESTYSPQQMSKIQIFMKQNPNVKSTNDAAQILKQHGYI